MTSAENGHYQPIELLIYRSSGGQITIIRQTKQVHAHGNDIGFTVDNTTGNIYAEKVNHTTARTVTIAHAKALRGSFSVLDGSLTDTGLGVDQSARTAIADVSNLQTVLDDKSDVGHTHPEYGLKASSNTWTSINYFDNAIGLRNNQSYSGGANLNFIGRKSTDKFLFSREGYANIAALLDVSQLSAERNYILPDQGGTIALTSDLGGLSTSAEWGSITGTLANQADLWNVLTQIDIVDNLDGTYTFTDAQGGTTVIGDTSVSTLVNNGDGTYTYTDETGATQSIDTNASSNPYNNAISGLAAINVQSAIDEVYAAIGDDLGNHTATQTLNMDGNSLDNVSEIRPSGRFNIGGYGDGQGFGNLYSFGLMIEPVRTYGPIRYWKISNGLSNGHLEIQSENSTNENGYTTVATIAIDGTPAVSTDLTTKAYVDAAVGGAGGGDAGTFDGLDSTQFLRSDVDDTFDGNLTVTGDVSVSVNGSSNLNPRIIGAVDMNGSGEGAAFQFGDEYNSIENQYTYGLALNSYHTIIFRGGHRTLGGRMNFQDAGGWYDPDTAESVRFLLTGADDGVALQQVSASPTGTSMHLKNSAGTKIWQVNADGSTTADAFIKSGATSDDVLLGDGSTTSLAAIGGGGGGNVTKVGTPVNNQVGVWTGDGTIEGTPDVTYDGSQFKISRNRTGTYNKTAGFYVPNMANGDWNEFIFGKDESTNDRISLAFKHVAAGSADNEFKAIFYGGEAMTFNGHGTLTVKAADTTSYKYNNSNSGIVHAPDGGYFSTSTSSITGAIEVALPAATEGAADMISFEVHIFRYTGGAGGGKSHKFIIHGYNYQAAGGTTWANCNATQLTSVANDELTVRFGNNGTQPCIWIGETTTAWEYPQVQVMNVTAGYSTNIKNYLSDWSVSITPTLGEVDATASTNLTASSSLEGLKLSQSGNYWGVIPHVTSGGTIEIGKYIDFHDTDGDTGDYSYRITTAQNEISFPKNVKFSEDSGAVDFYGVGRFYVSAASPSYQRMDARSDGTEARLHCYGVPESGTGATSFKQAWWDGGSYLNVTAVSGTATFDAAIYADRFQTSNSGDGATLLTFNSDRAWSFLQEGSGSGTRLALRDLTGGKTFEIQNNSGVKQFEFWTGGGVAYATDWTNYSDERLKSDIKPLTGKKMNVDWKSYTFKKEDRVRYGVIAQELEEHHPELIRVSDDGMKAVSYTDLLVCKMAEKDEEINTLNARVERLEAMVEQILNNR
ncbi:tail fiber domain-containing protein [Zeaxanthinibacter sp. PT1]|uniref:tail fiber domain-containing protein n=1 Tax=Zeaxanthinibacter TaxID=561554 RepID=UPI0023494A9D|nr:tail fiber domain-containing protein [Zeaxanthinibacter sp. PT1]MDC6350693.1 tail fiber domain-containing protein [Zeaxanthinibacter sp. PT1]